MASVGIPNPWSGLENLDTKISKIPGIKIYFFSTSRNLKFLLKLFQTRNSWFYVISKFLSSWSFFYVNYVIYRQKRHLWSSNNRNLIKFQIEKQIYERHTQKFVADRFVCLYSDIRPAPAMRWSKYQVTPEQYPMGYLYPPFC